MPFPEFNDKTIAWARLVLSERDNGIDLNVKSTRLSPMCVQIEIEDRFENPPSCWQPKIIKQLGSELRCPEKLMKDQAMMSEDLGSIIVKGIAHEPSIGILITAILSSIYKTYPEVGLSRTRIVVADSTVNHERST